MYFSLRYIASLFVVSPLLLVPNYALALDFSEAYQNLLKNNLTYRRAQLDFQADKTLISQAKAELLPRISANASTGFIRNDVTNLEDPSIDPLALNDEQQIDFDGETRLRNEVSIQLRQPIINLSLRSRVKQAKSQVLESEQRLKLVLGEQLLTLTEVYFGYQQAITGIDISTRELESINKHRLLTANRLESGLNTKSDVLEALSRQKTAQIILLEDQKSIEFFKRRLVRILRNKNIILNSKIVNEAKVFDNSDHENLDSLLNDSIENNIEIELQKRVVKSAKSAIRLDKSVNYPTLDLAASSRRSETEAFEVGDEDERSDDRVLLELNIPLFAGNGPNAKLRESKLRFEAEKVELENIIELQSERVIEAFNDRNTVYKKMAFYKEAFLAAEESLQLRQEGFLEGITNSLDVLNAFREKHRSERLWRDSQFEYLTEIVRLNIALGKVGVEDIKLIDEYFQDKNNIVIQDENKSKNTQKISLREQKEKPIREFINNWEKAWEEGDTEKYLSFYSNSFQPEKSLSLSEWQSQRKKRVIPEKNIELSISDLDIDFIDGRDGIQISFKQNYDTDNFSDQSRKELLIQSTNNGYEILSEVEL